MNLDSIGGLYRSGATEGAGYRVRAFGWGVVAVATSGAIAFASARPEMVETPTSFIGSTSFPQVGSVSDFRAVMAAVLFAIPIFLYLEMLAVFVSRGLRDTHVSVREAWSEAIRRFLEALAASAIYTGLIFLLWISFILYVVTGHAIVRSTAWMALFVNYRRHSASFCDLLAGLHGGWRADFCCGRECRLAGSHPARIADLLRARQIYNRQVRHFDVLYVIYFQYTGNTIRASC